MRILALVQGVYGERIVSHIQANCPKSWEVNYYKVPPISIPIVDDPEEFLPDKLLDADLILHLAESSQAAQLLSGVVNMTGAKAVIAPIDNSNWIPKGMRNQLNRELTKLKVDIVFPEPFCSITQSSVGYGRTYESYDNKLIAEFATHFGKPILKVELDKDNHLITGAIIERGAPCGSTQYTVNRIKGYNKENIIPHAGLMCLHYPCLASMQFENTDEGVDTIMHNSGRIFNEAVATSLEKS